MAKIVAHEGNKLTLQITVELTGSLMDMEKIIVGGCNEMGGLATAEALQKFDTEKRGEVKMTVRDKTKKTYQTPYGGVLIQRHVYQSSKGGKIYCPLENNAQIIRGATPNKHNKSRINMPT